MKKTLTIMAALLTTLTLAAQTLNVATGSTTDQYPAAQAGEMTFSGGTQLSILGKSYNLGEVTAMYTDLTAVTDNKVSVVYDGAGALVYVAGNVARHVSVSVSGAHVSIVQSAGVDETVGEITYTLSGNSTDGEFYMEGSYKATVELNGLTLTNTNPVYSGAAIHIQNGKRINIKVAGGTTNTLTDAPSGSQKGCLYVKGHAEFKQKGTLNIRANVKHGIKAGEYISVKNATLNILSAAGDGISCNEYFLMESGSISIGNVGDDGIQADIAGSEGISTGETTGHEGEDSGNIYIAGGTLTATITADAAKGIKAAGDMTVSGGTISIDNSGNGIWDSTKAKTKAASCLSTDGNLYITGGTLTLSSTGTGGKGINTDGTLTATGGTTTITTSGNAVAASASGTLTVVTNSRSLDSYSSNYKSSPKGIKADGAILISDDAVISVTTTGTGGEGIESKTSITITGGQTTVVAADDAINASYNTTTNGSGDLTISGGYVYARSTGNDGLDSNGNLYISGGLVYAIGSGGAEKSIDANTEENKKLYITGGTIIAVGDLENGSSIAGGTCKYTTSWTGQSWYALYNGSTLAAAFQTPAKSSGGGGMGPGGGSSSQKLIVYTASTPAIKSGITISGGTELFGGTANIGGTASGGSTVSLSTYTSSGGGWGR